MIQSENSIEASWKELNSKSLAQQMSQHLEFLGLDWIRNLESHALEKKPHSVALCWSRITRYGERTPILL